MFIGKCNAKDPQLMTFIPLLTACSKPDIQCDAFKQCVETQIRQQLPDAE